MIMLARVVPYGGNAVRYALEKEKAKMVKVNHMPEGIDPTAIWYMMKHHCQLHQQDRTVGRKLERFMAQFVISPSKEEAANFTTNDWGRNCPRYSPAGIRDACRRQCRSSKREKAR